MGSTTCSRRVRVVWPVAGDDAGRDGDAERRARDVSPALPGREAGERRFESGRFASGMSFQPRLELAANLFLIPKVSGKARSPA
ncbi:hypothetical protein NIIDMKKI_12090 [Mycobacterium kansasii]|uniref:Uncharacterized protein n=1 Tax=Mycobacterium kansasii TaxID=1768 RepID=A0A7G1I6U4_MYCKA|nr:hypothetical protein NIIDMKKI_12090 [Mycobacterium kansasii]